MELKDIIRDKRKEAGLTQEALGLLVFPQISKQDISNIERGGSISIERANLILHPLGYCVKLVTEKIN